MTRSAPRGGGVRLGGLARLFARAPDDPDGDDALFRQIEELILGGPRRYTRAQLVEEYHLDAEQITALWRALGFPAVGDDEVIFTDGDREALSRLLRLRAAGMVPGETEDAMARSIGQAMAGLADWQTEMLYQLVDYGNHTVSGREILEIGEQVIPLLESMQSYIWRRHLAASASRLLTGTPDGSRSCSLTVGFADLVGFTRASRRLRPAELTALVEQFHGIAAEAVATCRGRVVKTVGDEVLFVAEVPGDGVEIGLRLIERVAGARAAGARSLPPPRIGIALGEVITRFGDVYGEVVNIAARLTAQARPARILVDRNLAHVLENDGRYLLRARPPVAVRGYRHLRQWEVRRADRAADPTTVARAE